MTDDEITRLVDFLAANPTAGELIVGTGGCRVAGRGKGKSGGYRTITFYAGELAGVPSHGVLQRREDELVQVGVQ
jgi:hypothetical protein